MVRWAVLAAALAGCGFRGVALTDAHAGADDAPLGTDGTTPADDATTRVDAAPTADATMCFGTGLLRICLDALPTGGVTLLGTIATDGAACTQLVAQASGPMLCVIAGTTINGPGATVVTGTRPLVLVAISTLSISGTLDLSSNTARTGAGANFAPICNQATYTAGSGEDDGGGGGGGAGGGFGTPGATGGLGDTNDNLPPTPHMGQPGKAGMQQPKPTLLRGGCPGGSGGGGSGTVTTTLGGPGGASGGALYLIAGSSITIGGNVFASGAGGGAVAGAAGYEMGGGGGGSGGMIGLDAPAIEIDGIVAANGGAGAGGGGNVGGTVGAPGTTTSYNVRAAHGVGDTSGTAGDGGDGTAVGATNALPLASTVSGGGGGGGGVGVIWLDGALTNGAKVSPPPTPH